MRVRCDVRNCAVAAFVVILVGSDPITSAAATPQEPEEKGTQSVAGVTVTAEADAWRGIPAELTRVIPLLVTLENNGSSAIRLRYSEFALVDGAKRAPALPPFQIEGTEVVGTTGVLAPYTYPLTGFYVAPYLVRFYPGLSPFDGVFVYDPFFYSSYYPRFASLQLPTTDMVQKAMPEGVLQPGGRITGFLYFEDVDIGDVNGDDDMGVFRMDIAEATSGRTVGTIQIPLEID